MIFESLKRGTIEIVLLAMLQDGDKYGYQLVQEIFTRSKGGYTLQEGSMYPSLYRLQERGYVSTRKELVGKKRTRIYYHLEDAGRVHLKQLLEEYHKITSAVGYILEPQSSQEVTR